MDLIEKLQKEGFTEEQINFALEISKTALLHTDKLDKLQKECGLSRNKAERLLQIISESESSAVAIEEKVSEKKGNPSILGRIVSVGFLLYAIIKIANGKGTIVDYGFVIITAGILFYSMVNKNE